MNKKKLSHSNLNSSITSVLAALLCIVIGMAVGFLVLLAINPAHAWADGFVRILKGGFHDAPYGVGKELANAAPLIMTGLSVGFAFKTGLFNIGAAGQYTLGAYGALYCAIMLKLPWFVCLLAAAILGGLWGAIPGFFKAYFNINEVITSIMFNWIGLYLVNELIYQNGTGPMYDVRNTRTLNLGKNAELSKALIPDFGLNKMFQTNSTTIAIFLAAAVAILIWVILNKTTFGYELKAVGLNKSAARYAGINEKKNIILSMAIAGALAGFGAGLYFLSNVSQWNPLNSTSLPAMGFNGISVALLASRTTGFGTQYRILCKATVVVPGAQEEYVVVTLQHSWLSKAEILDIGDPLCLTNLDYEKGAVGAWQEAESPAMTEEATAAFNKATEGLVGVDYVPVTLLCTQTVAGTNYRILCEATTVYPGAEMHYAVVNVYESLEGNANIISVTDGYVS